MGRLGYRALDEHDFALVNPLQVSSSQWQDLPVVALTPKALQGQAHLTPVLVDLGRMQRDARTALLARSEAWDRGHDAPFFSALLIAGVTPQRLASHLCKQFIARHPTMGHCWMRIHDPRVFQHLRWVLSTAQINSLLGPVTTWTWRTLDGDWQRHPRTEQSEAAPLTTAQWDTLSRVGVLNRTLLQLRRNTPELPVDDALSQNVEKLLSESVTRHGLQDESDRRFYVEQVIRIHPLIHGHPEIARRLTQARVGESTYVGACSDLDDDLISRIKVELKYRSTRTHA